MRSVVLGRDSEVMIFKLFFVVRVRLKFDRNLFKYFITVSQKFSPPEGPYDRI